MDSDGHVGRARFAEGCGGREGVADRVEDLGTRQSPPVTIEPAGGVPAPTGPKVLVGLLAPQ